jgi:predicted amidohydrolase
MRVGFVQFKPRLLDVDGNVDAAIRLIGRKQADLIVLPELFNTGYNFRTRKELESVAEPIPSGSTTQMLRDVSKRNGTTIVAGLAERKGTNYYNSAVVVRNGKYLGTYRKVHLFFNEKKFFKRGSELKVFGNVGVMVCFDWYFPESVRSLMLKGAEVIAHPSNLVLPHCPESMKIRALENKVYTVTADRVGVERGLRFIGQSEIVDPMGRVLYRASAKSEECVVREINLGLARDKAVTPMNNLIGDMFPAAYVS